MARYMTDIERKALREFEEEQLKEIEKWYGSEDFQIGAGNEYITLRFGYWREIDTKELSEVIDRKVELDMEIYDDDCGWQYSYKII